MTTIKEAISELQRAVGEAVPGMDVSVNISFTPAKQVSQKVKKVEEPKQHPSDLKALRAYLNAYAGKVGAKKAKDLVSKFTTDETSNPEKIPQEKYADMIKSINIAEIDLSKDKDKEAA
jgi:glutamate synthase domain-containing protein 3